MGRRLCIVIPPSSPSRGIEWNPDEILGELAFKVRVREVSEKHKIQTRQSAE